MRAFILMALSLILLGCTASQPLIPQPAPSSSLPSLPGQSHLALPPVQHGGAAGIASANDSESAANTSASGQASSANASAANYSGRLRADYYYSRYCGYCKLAGPIVEAEEAAFGNRIEWRKFDVYTPEGYDEFDKMAISNNLSNNSRVVPIIIAGGRMLIGFPEINSTLHGLLMNMTG